MQLSEIRIINYRNFLNTTVSFKEGVNIVIGPNNAGKTNLLKAINLLSKREKFQIEDFNYNDLFDKKLEYRNIPPKIEFHYVIEHFFNPDQDEVDNAIIKLKNFIIYNDAGDLFQETTGLYKIKGSFKIIFELNDKYYAEYKKQMGEISKDLEPLAFFEEFKNKLEIFIDKYEWGYYNDTDDIHSSQTDIKDIFNIDFILADRTTDRILPETKKFIKQKIDENEADKFEVNRNISILINSRFPSISKEIESFYEIDQGKIGIGKGNNKIASGFKYDSSLEEHFYFSLVDKNKGYSLPLENNGLGHNNLVQIYNIIKFKVYDDYNILLIEEPEAHLHPAMQYQLFSYLQTLESDSKEKIKNQIIITTHSPNISASSKIDDLISIHYYNQESSCCVDTENLGEKFILDEVPKDISESIEKLNERLAAAKSHLVKFLDITRSDMLFTEKTILVEGLAEKLLIPLFAENEGIDLIDNHISIVEVGGINFDHFLPIFKNTKSKCLCIRDCDYNY